MSFQLKPYHAPDFTSACLSCAPSCTFAPAVADAVVPDGFHAFTLFPEYFKVQGTWVLAAESRMDCVAVLKPDGTIASVEARRVKKGDLVAIGRRETGEDGIFVWEKGFASSGPQNQTFTFRQKRSRETSYSRDYAELADLLAYEHDHGYVVWVLGPACAFDVSARNAMSRLIKAGHVQAVLAGNALATHDLEASYLKTALGQDIVTREAVPNGHYHHLETINAVRESGSIRQFIKDHDLTRGIVTTANEMNVPLVLCGSIRDDGPLPEVIGNAYRAQDAMREQVKKATTVIALATTLHAIATGNMLPSFRLTSDGVIRETFFYDVDISEFAVNKLADRGSLTAKGIVTNVQDFLTNLTRRLGLDD